MARSGKISVHLYGSFRGHTLTIPTTMMVWLHTTIVRAPAQVPRIFLLRKTLAL
jgi:hypothetical protein